MRTKILLIPLACMLAAFSSCSVCHDGPSLETCPRDTVLRYTLSGEDCTFANYAEYGLWVPGGNKPVAGIMVLQHGCTMEVFGITKPYDLQYQAFARKWNLAILETALHGPCRVWQHPESGSAAAVLNVLAKASESLNRPEMTDAPWLIWGHSGGGQWALAMLRDSPERIMAAVSYSAGRDPQWDYSSKVSEVPVLLRHAGQNDLPFALCEVTAIHAFEKFRALDAPASVVRNVGENHNYSQLRHMMIPFFESALRVRLPKRSGGDMRPVTPSKAWLGDTLTFEIFPESGYKGDKSSLCRFPDKGAAMAWKEYASTNDVMDVTPPPAPGPVTVSVDGDSLLVRWSAEADPESGIGCFIIRADGEEPLRIPENGDYQSFDRNGDNTYPTDPPAMEARLPRPEGKRVRITVENVNQYGLSSKRTVIIRNAGLHK